jgi:hypothetical protein
MMKTQKSRRRALRRDGKSLKYRALRIEDIEQRLLLDTPRLEQLIAA